MMRTHQAFFFFFFLREGEVCWRNFQYFNCHRESGWGNTSSFTLHQSCLATVSPCHLMFSPQRAGDEVVYQRVKYGCAVSRDLVCALLRLFFYTAHRTGRGIYYSCNSLKCLPLADFFCPSGHTVHSV